MDTQGESESHTSFPSDRYGEKCLLSDSRRVPFTVSIVLSPAGDLGHRLHVGRNLEEAWWNVVGDASNDSA